MFLVWEQDGGEMWGQLFTSLGTMCVSACEHPAEDWDGRHMSAPVHQMATCHVTDPKHTAEICLMASSGLIVRELTNNVNNCVNHCTVSTTIIYGEICTILWSSGKTAGLIQRSGLKHEIVNSAAVGSHSTSEFEFTHL